MNWEKSEIKSVSVPKVTSLNNSCELTQSNHIYAYEIPQRYEQMHIGKTD